MQKYMFVQLFSDCAATCDGVDTKSQRDAHRHGDRPLRGSYRGRRANLDLSGDRNQSTTDAAGLYSFPNLLPGIYELKAAISGFRDFVQMGIALRANEMARLNFGMQLGEARQTLEVEGSASP